MSHAIHQADLTLAQARELILQQLSCVSSPELMPLQQAGGRILATDVLSPCPIPAYDNAAMDGYAFASSARELSDDTDLRLVVVGQALAGHPYHTEVEPAQCVQIMTGAALPAGCDCVVPHELVKRLDHTIHLPVAAIRAGQHIRRRAEDLAKDQLALAAGVRLGAVELGLLASLGLANVELRQTLRVALFSSGDELKEPGETLSAAQHYDVNRYSLRHLLQQLGCEVIDLGIVADSSPELIATLQQACKQAQVVMSSGGISSGVADLIRPALNSMGELHFRQLAIKPGRPFAFGQLQHHGHTASLFGLPGNPIASLVCFHFLVRPALLKLMGAQELAQPALFARLSSPIPKRPGRREFLRGRVQVAADGQLSVEADVKQGSALLFGLSQANCLIELDEQQAELTAGTLVRLHLLANLFG